MTVGMGMGVGMCQAMAPTITSFQHYRRTYSTAVDGNVNNTAGSSSSSPSVNRRNINEPTPSVSHWWHLVY